MAILGIDEVGRGPWAGPLVVGACILPEAIEGLNDSKKLTAKRREVLAEEIRQHAVFGLGWVSAAELDDLGLSEALRKACRKAVKEVKAKGVPFSEIVIDGTINFLSDTPLGKYVRVLPKADFLIPEVSAASIIAKVSRDKYMTDLTATYPGYGFEKHVGYGTAAHKKAIEELGVCPEHRRSFKPIAQLIETVGLNSDCENYSNTVKSTRCETSKKSIETSKKNDKTKKNIEIKKNAGMLAEEAVAKKLTEDGHKILERNWKTKYCEIDIVSEFECELYFTEVKYRRNTLNSSGFDSITDKKLEQMRFAAEFYLETENDKLQKDKKEAHLAAAEVSGDNFTVTSFIVLD